MEQNQVNNSGESGSVRNDAAGFRTVPNGSESFGNMPNSSEEFRTVPKSSERSESHTLTVREAARMFEAAGVARTERSIVNWCQPNRTGIARLDSYFDPNERKYFLTPESVNRAIQEEIQKSKRPLESPGSEPVGSVPKAEEKPAATAERVDERTKELERENLDLKIANRGKDYLIDKLTDERKGFFDQLLTATRKVGELETRLLQLEGPKPSNQ